MSSQTLHLPANRPTIPFGRLLNPDLILIVRTIHINSVFNS